MIQQPELFEKLKNNFDIGTPWIQLNKYSKTPVSDILITIKTTKIKWIDSIAKNQPGVLAFTSKVVKILRNYYTLKKIMTKKYHQN